MNLPNTAANRWLAFAPKCRLRELSAGNPPSLLIATSSPADSKLGSELFEATRENVTETFNPLPSISPHLILSASRSASASRSCPVGSRSPRRASRLRVCSPPRSHRGRRCNDDDAPESQKNTLGMAACHTTADPIKAATMIARRISAEIRQQEQLPATPLVWDLRIISIHFRFSPSSPHRVAEIFGGTRSVASACDSIELAITNNVTFIRIALGASVDPAQFSFPVAFLPRSRRDPAANGVAEI